MAGARSASASSLAGGAAAGKKAPAPNLKSIGRRGPKAGSAPVVLYNVNLHETLNLRPADKGMQQKMNNFLRCHYTKRRHAMNPRLTRLLYEIGQHYPGRRIEVVSGYRHPRFAKNPHSPHMKGLACDMRVVGVKNTELRDFFRQRFKSVGVGYYPNSSFVHLDVRRGASAFWIDYSGPGETAIYSRNALDDLRLSRTENWRPTTIDPAWADTDEPTDSADYREPAAQAAEAGEAAAGEDGVIAPGAEPDERSSDPEDDGNPEGASPEGMKADR